MEAKDDTSSSARRVRKKKSTRVPKREKQDARQHEHVLAENGRDLESVSGVHTGEAACMDGRDQRMTIDPDVCVTPETGPLTLEIGTVDQEQEDRQMDI
jgi:hypothetical protein